MLKKSDFDDMFFRIDSAKSLKRMANAHLIPSVLKLNDNQARYLIYLYDHKSPFIKAYPDQDQRRKAVKDWISMPQTKVDACNDFDNDEIVNCITEILLAQGNRTWAEIVATEQMFYENLNRLIGKTDMDRDKDVLQALKIKNEIRVIQRQISQDLDALWAAFAGDNKEVKDKIAASLKYTPEMIADVQ